MAYHQQFDFGNEAKAPTSHRPGYANHQLYQRERNGYREVPPNNQRYDDYGQDVRQESRGDGYPYHNEYIGNQGYSGNMHNGSLSHNPNGARRSPPLGYEARRHYGNVQTQRLQPNHQKQAGPRNPGFPYSPLPQPVNRQYPQDNTREQTTPQRTAPSYDAVLDPPHQRYPVNNGYTASNGYNDSRQRNLNEHIYGSNNGRPQNSHRRGRSNGHDEGLVYEEWRQDEPYDVRKDLANQRPSRDQQRSRSHGRQNLDKRKIFDDPTQQDTMAWDNPFPTFPAAKKKGMQNNGNVNGPTADMRIDDNDQSHPGSRPQTADSKSKSSRERPQHGYHENQLRSPPSSRNHHGVGQAPTNFQEFPARETERPYGNANRPRPSTGRRSDDNSFGMATTSAAFQPNTERSKTMPDNVSSAALRSGIGKEYVSPSVWQEPGPTGGYFGPADSTYMQDRPSTASESRPVGPVRSRSNESSQLRRDETGPQQSKGMTQDTNNRALRQDSIADVYDSYYDGSTANSPDQSQRGYRAYQPPIAEEIPDFDASPITNPGHYRGMTIDKHLQPQKSPPAMPPMPSQYQHHHAAGLDRGQAHGQVLRSRSQPDLKDRRSPRVQPSDGFDFGIPFEASQVAPRSYGERDTGPPRQSPPDESFERADYRHQHSTFRENPRQPPAPYRMNERSTPTEQYSQSTSRAPPSQPRPPLQQRPSPNDYPRGPGGRPSPDARASPALPPSSFPIRPDALPAHPAPVRTGPTSPPPSFPMQPDALPSHPAPIRAGLMSSPSPNQPPKPVPVRNYNSNNSPLQSFSPVQPPSSSRPAEDRKLPTPVTQDELERLRQAVKMNQSDQKTQMILAKKLVEAAADLDDATPRLDQRTIQRTREKYYMESHKIIKRLVSTGYADAMFFLGDCYSQPRLGLEKDSKEAFTLYQSAAKAGHAQAAFRVAVCCELGMEEDGGTKRDLGKAVQWYKRAAQLGDTPAMYKIGVIQLKGLLGQPKDTGEAVAWLGRAADKADKDNPHALHELVSAPRNANSSNGITYELTNILVTGFVA